MEAQSPKRRRVYSLEPNKVVQEVFTRNYVRYLVPALVKIKESGSSEHNKHCDFHNVVKHEVGMAMVFSAQGFAWSDALKVKLLRGHANVDSNSTSFDENEGSDDKGSSLNICDQDVMVPMNLISSNSNPSSKSKYIDMPENKRNCLVGEENEDEVTNNKLTCLRRLIPGGEKMCNEQMVVELESYISCLQMQVNVLQCLAKTP
ncbi:hypothetical protein TanjilG_19746 [Lupinus angustifolius]|uniref:IBH1-like N-terminal domain-containing protein n=1 Tax=Lupinus angustifolius TaxID=3871 RepID=A0A394DL86_LUPAN|nr:PREDICTED: uncharacterized protein At4g30180-like isoform X1 [Lupinus angustifolius]OIW20681.1 hypothetical protein TanjilG_19746 [Lupinus angustifolius]